MRLAALALFSVLAAEAKEPLLLNAPIRVTVCMQELADFPTSMQAKGIVTWMFAGIGVRITWHDMSGCPAQSILISLSDEAPARFHRGALAFALPYEGTHIVLFYDRIAMASRALRPRLMAHVMVHEITHVLEGVAKHSEEGVMKAQWNKEDFDHMIGKCLSFTPEDVEMIHAGLVVRSAR